MLHVRGTAGPRPIPRSIHIVAAVLSVADIQRDMPDGERVVVAIAAAASAVTVDAAASVRATAAVTAAVAVTALR